jgi:hypothetical protein
VITVRILRPTVAAGEPRGVGERLTLPDAEARDLCALGKAEVIITMPPEDGAPVPQHADPSPDRRRRQGSR